MPVWHEGKIVEVVEARPDLISTRVALADGEIDAVGFPAMLGPVAVGDRVIVNTTGIELELGTGGIGFILWNLDGTGPPGSPAGHIVKLRYTPWQTAVLAAEEPDSPHHERLVDVESIDSMAVVACGLHSQVAGVAAGIKERRPDARVGYLMTDGAALPLPWSDLARSLKDAGLIDVTCTCGHAFGGDLEAINVFSGLAALRHAADTDVAIVAMGPGIVGTGTALGFSGMEQGQVLDATAALGGRPIACLRISFAERRARHQGVSHHTLTALRLAARERCTIVVPELDAGAASTIEKQLAAAGIAARHDVVIADGGPGLDRMRAAGIAATSMGRSIDDDPAGWLAAAAAGSVAAT